MNPDGHVCLDHVASLAACAQAWGLDRKTIIWGYWHGEIRMKKSGGTWVVDLDSMIAWFGFPKDAAILFPEMG